jgi:hypothetical protein
MGMPKRCSFVCDCLVREPTHVQKQTLPWPLRAEKIVHITKFWSLDSLKPAHNLRAVVEVVPMVAGADPVVVRGGVVGLVVGVSRGVVQLAGLGVLAGGLGVEGSSGLAVEGLEHFCKQGSSN